MKEGKGKRGCLTLSGKIWRKSHWYAPSNTRARSLAATQRHIRIQSNPHHHRDLLEDIQISQGENERVSFQERERFPSFSRVFPRRHLQRRVVAYSWITPNPPEADKRDAHTRLENSTSSRENKTWEDCERSFFSFSFSLRDSIVFVFVSGRCRHSSCSRSSLSVLLLLCISLVPLFLHEVSLFGRPNRRGPARQLNARGVAILLRGSSLTHHLSWPPLPPLPECSQPRNLCLTFLPSHIHLHATLLI